MNIWPFSVGRDIAQVKLAFALRRTALAEGEQPAESAIGGAIARIDQQARTVL